MANQDLFKEAIAEAKAVREAAIANAREALEESLTPHLKSMLAARLQELENEEVEEVISEEEVEEEAVEEAKKDDEMEEAKHEDEDAMEEAQGNIDAHEENPHDQLEEEGEAVAEAEKEEAEDDSEKSEDEAEEEKAEEEEAKEDEVEVKDMEVEDLKALIRDLIAQEMSGEAGEEEAEMEVDAEAQPEDMVAAEDEEINLEELLAELENDLGEEVVQEEEVTEEVNPLQAELDQALATIEELRGNLSEVNLLNAKLLYLNRIFRANNLTEAQKVSTIAAFDKATSAKEVKLVYETLKEGFVTKKESIKENKGFASKAAGVAPNKEVIQVNEQVLRMQKLAGIIR